MSEKKLMLGNQAVARGLFESGCVFVSSYPGTPSTEITEYAASYDCLHAEWAPNEKVAVEAALGAAIGGGRSFSGMKHVGLNVAADPVFTASYTGINAGLVIAVADDPGMHSSQNEQDSRHYARAAKLPCIEPSDSGECLEFTKLAFEMSEEYDTPVLLRLSTRVSHSQSSVEINDRVEHALKDYEKNIQKYVMMPAMARARHVVVENRMSKLAEFAETCEINRAEYHDKTIGVISSGIAYEYAREALGDKASYLKLGMVYPLPVELIRKFASEVDKLYVVEELDGFIEEHCRANGITVIGKEVFSKLGELSTEIVREKILGDQPPVPAIAGDLPVRPPVLCPGCPHRGLFYVLKKLGVTVSGDIGCYTLGANAPMGMIDVCVCMGASISALHGMNMVRGAEFAKKSLAVIGDSTFMHSGITGLVNSVYNQSPSTVLILDNSITGMTGHQNNPATGLTLQGKPAPKLVLEDVCRALGVNRVRIVDPHDLDVLETVINEELAAEEPSVVIARRPCVLLPEVERGRPYVSDREKCKGCKACMKLGCPAISFEDKRAGVDISLCVGCGLCQRVCKFGAMEVSK